MCALGNCVYFQEICPIKKNPQIRPSVRFLNNRSVKYRLLTKSRHLHRSVTQQVNASVLLKMCLTGTVETFCHLTCNRQESCDSAVCLRFWRIEVCRHGYRNTASPSPDITHQRGHRMYGTIPQPPSTGCDHVTGRVSRRLIGRLSTVCPRTKARRRPATCCQTNDVPGGRRRRQTS